MADPVLMPQALSRGSSQAGNQNIVAWFIWVDRYPNCVLLDGGLGHVLSERNNDLDVGTLWSGRLLLNNLAELRTVACLWLSAGSDLILTATYQATIANITSEFSLCPSDAVQVMHSSVVLLNETIDSFWNGLSCSSRMRRRRPKVGVSMGPYSATLPGTSEYSGLYVDVTYSDFVQFHSERCAVFSNLRCDSSKADFGILCFETIGNTEEVLAIANVMGCSQRADIPFWVSFQCRDKLRLACGDLLSEVVQVMLHRCKFRNLVAIGVNCVSVHDCGPLLEIVAQSVKSHMDCAGDGAWRVDTVVYPNSGELWTESGWISGNGSTKLASESWAACVQATGARLQGGCCRTGVSHVLALDSLRARR